ncbi:hypothetical protein ECSTECC16502_0661 [Escherichia coli STEC_C165-02]|nr:hypothetical protein ECSTECC16502_0661 [Escherichia coli STEC_C165-02]KDX26643.1 hypothetical protein AB41_3940 [Escherichia coli 1-250-04_S1_C2]KDY08630.1 hypothetical protein AC72_4218 [Escherichia coli 2-316-03_S4_C1]KEL89579.1 hypothetical protein AB94_4363 [Escherichia coli 5-366-08_S3_C1]
MVFIDLMNMILRSIKCHNILIYMYLLNLLISFMYGFIN